VKGTIFTMMRPAMLYEMEAVSVTKKKKKKSRWKWLKWWSIGVIRMDKLKNETVREKLKVAEFGGKLHEAKLRLFWLVHLKRRS